MAVDQALQYFNTLGRPEWTMLAEVISAMDTGLGDASQSIDDLQSQIDSITNNGVSVVDPNLPNVGAFAATIAYWQNSDGSWFYQLSGTWKLPIGSGIEEVAIYQRQDTPTPPSGAADIVIVPLASTSTSFRTDWLMMPDQSLLVPGPYKIRLFAVSGDGQGHFNTVYTTGSKSTPSVLIAIVNQPGGLLLDRSDPTSFDSTDFDIVGTAFQVKNIKSNKIEVGSTLKVGGGTGLFTGPGQIGVFDTGNIMDAWFGRRIQTGTCNTSGTAVTRTAGEYFLPSMATQPMDINGTIYIVSSFTDQNNVVLATSAGTHTGVPFNARTTTYGGWAAKFWVGGSAPENAPFYVDNFGTLTINNALITLTSGSNTVTLDPVTAKITSSDGTSNSELYAGLLKLSKNGGFDKLEFTYLGMDLYDSTGLNTTSLGLNKFTMIRENNNLTWEQDVYGHYPIHVMSRANGTLASPTNCAAGDIIGMISFAGQGFSPATIEAKVDGLGATIDLLFGSNAEVHGFTGGFHGDFHGGTFYAGSLAGVGGSQTVVSGVSTSDVTVVTAYTLSVTYDPVTGNVSGVSLNTPSTATIHNPTVGSNNTLTFNSGLLTHIV